MNGGVIGKTQGVIRRGSILTIDDVSNDNYGARFPTDGLVNYCPLTSNGNDVIGSLDLTANNGLTFSADGALGDSATKRYLSAIVTFPTVFTWVIQVKYLYNVNHYSMTVMASTDIARYIFGFETSDPITDKTIKLTYGKDSYGNSAAGIGLGTPQSFDLTDGKYHTIAIMGATAGRKKAALWIDGELISTAMPYAYTMSTSFAIGRCGAGDWGYSNSLWRHFRVYNRHLTTHELLYLR